MLVFVISRYVRVFKLPNEGGNVPKIAVPDNRMSITFPIAPHMIPNQPQGLASGTSSVHVQFRKEFKLVA
jgi:hypothetical protein